MVKQLSSTLALAATILLVGSAVALWGGPQTKQKPKSTPSTQAVKPPPKPANDQGPKGLRPASKRTFAEPQTPGGPDLSLSVNLLHAGMGIEGKAILLELSVRAPREAANDGSDIAVKAIDLAKPGGFWGELFTLEIRDDNGKLVSNTKARLVSKGGPAGRMDGERSGWLVWVIEPTDGRLPAGEYTFQAILDTSKVSGDGWKGKVWSAHADLTLKAATAELTEDERRIVALVEIRILTVGDRHAEALAACDRFLSGQPKDGTILEEKGDVLVRLRKPREALATYDAALAIEPEYEENAVQEPPTNLIAKRNAAAEASKKAP